MQMPFVLVAVFLFAVLSGAVGAPQPQVHEFAVVAKKYAFVPERFEVTEGDEVRFVVTSTDTDHGFEIRQLRIKELVPENEKRANRIVRERHTYTLSTGTQRLGIGRVIHSASSSEMS